MQKSGNSGIVYLIGAGPGDPGLITVRGLECLRRADVVVYDYLANPGFLAEAPKAEHIYVGKSRGRHHTPQEQINVLLAEKARLGKVVARLKGGDPFLFGRGGEEARFLRQEGIHFEVVPGVTAGFAAAAYAGIPLTHRDFTATLSLVSGHEDPSRKMSRIDWSKLASGGDTLVFYMGMTNLPVIAERLMAHGRPPGTPVAIIRWATTPRQETLTARLDDVVERARNAQIGPPAIIVIGEVVTLREELRWFDNRPLFGRRILVTRAADQAGDFCDLLRQEGADPILCPLIEIVPPQSWEELDEALERLPETDILVLTSANAVRIFLARLRETGRDLRALHGTTIVAVGPKTAAALEALGLSPDLIPENHHAEGVVNLLRKHGIAGRRILYPRAELARDLIPREMEAAGAEVISPIAYRTVLPEGTDPLLNEKLEGGLDAVTFTSPSTVENFMHLTGPQARKRLSGAAVFSIGPQTTAAAMRLGLTVAAEAESSTIEAIVIAMTDYFLEANSAPRKNSNPNAGPWTPQG